MLAYLAVHAQTVALLVLFLRVIHSTTSILMFVFPAVHARLLALQALSLKANNVSSRLAVNDAFPLKGARFLFHICFAGIDSGISLSYYI